MILDEERLGAALGGLAEQEPLADPPVERVLRRGRRARAVATAFTSAVTVGAVAVLGAGVVVLYGPRPPQPAGIVGAITASPTQAVIQRPGFRYVRTTDVGGELLVYRGTVDPTAPGTGSVVVSTNQTGPGRSAQEWRVVDGVGYWGLQSATSQTTTWTGCPTSVGVEAVWEAVGMSLRWGTQAEAVAGRVFLRPDRLSELLAKVGGEGTVSRLGNVGHGSAEVERYAITYLAEGSPKPLDATVEVSVVTGQIVSMTLSGARSKGGHAGYVAFFETYEFFDYGVEAATEAPANSKTDCSWAVTELGQR